jgi:hypothetical protein
VDRPPDGKGWIHAALDRLLIAAKFRHLFRILGVSEMQKPAPSRETRAFSV